MSLLKSLIKMKKTFSEGGWMWVFIIPHPCLTYEVTLQIYNFFQCLFQSQLKYSSNIDIPFPLTKYKIYWTQMPSLWLQPDRSFFRVTLLVADHSQQFSRQDSGGVGSVDKRAILSQADIPPHLCGTGCQMCPCSCQGAPGEKGEGVPWAGERCQAVAQSRGSGDSRSSYRGILKNRDLGHLKIYSLSDHLHLA